MPTKIRDGETVLFIGDSITDCHRRGPEAPYGNGYVKLFRDMLLIREPEKRIQVINKGLGGDKVTDLASGLQGRWTDDVIRNKPDWLFVLIGINDINSHLLNQPRAISPEIYEEAYNDVLARTRESLPGCRIFLGEPFYISHETEKHTFRYQLLQALQTYIGIVHKLSAKHKTGLLRLHKRFKELLERHESGLLGSDPAHPSLTGHLMIADEVYKAFSR